jgi:hypothetical protein
MDFRYAHIRPHLPLAIRAVERARSTPICMSPRVTSFGEESSSGGLARGSRHYLQSRLEFKAMVLMNKPAVSGIKKDE